MSRCMGVRQILLARVRGASLPRRGRIGVVNWLTDTIGVVNPVATILSVGMMLRYSFNMIREADAVEKAVRLVLDGPEQGGRAVRTRDMGGSNSTAEVGDAVAAALGDILDGN